MPRWRHGGDGKAFTHLRFGLVKPLEKGGVKRSRWRSKAEGGAFFIVEVAPMAGGEVAQGDRADGDADEAQGRVADGGGHPTDLSVAALADRQAEPGGRDVLAEPDRHG